MKPLRLTIKGLNSFIDEQTVDFERLSSGGMFCISGPTGSGKTTILDCVILALYAPREHNRGNMKDYVNSKCERGSITLDFESDGVRYRVWREFRKSSSSVAKLTNLDTGEVLADRADSVTDIIKQMLKLDKEDFTKVVILEQGKFAEFMSLTKAKRCETVAKLFDLERFEKLKETVGRAKSKYDKLLSENKAALEQYDGVTEEKLNLAKKQMRELKKEQSKLTEESANISDKLKELERARDAFERAKSASETVKESEALIAKAEQDRKKLSESEKAVAVLTEKLIELKEASDAAKVTLSLVKECRDDGEKAGKLRGKRDKLREEYKSAQDDAERLKGEISAYEGEKERDKAKCASIMRDIRALGYEISELSEASFAAVNATAKSDYTRLNEAEKKRAAAAKKIQTCEKLGELLIKGKNELIVKIKESETELSAAKEAYEHARLTQAAAAVRAGISDGDKCPVCGGIYHEGAHATVTDDELSTLKDACDKAEKAFAQHKENFDKNKIAQSENDAEMRSERATLNECEEIIGDKNSANAAKAEKLSAGGAQAAKNFAAAEKQISELTAKKSAAEKECERIELDGKRMGEEIAALEKKIEDRLKGQSPESAEKASSAAIKEYEYAEKETNAASEKFRTEKARIDTDEAVARAKRDEAQKTVLSLAGTQFDEKTYRKLKDRAVEITEEIHAKAASYGGAEKEAETIKSRLESKRKLTEERRTLDKKAELIAKLNKCVERDNKLFSFVAETKIQNFTRQASETLGSLTQGKFSLYYEDGDFYVADFFAGNVKRKVRTLSGGETFLTSMSLAMAISQEIASQNYEFFFLDEGFGTLHEQALDTVTAALRELSKDTVVGVVTHRTEVAAAVAAQLKVTPATEDEGSKVEILGV